MNFDVLGPFEIPRYGSKKLVTEESRKHLQEELEGEEEGLSGARGCYVFTVGKAFKPYYVGQACKTSIVREALNASNRDKYNQVLAEKKGKPFLFLVPMRTSWGTLSQSKTGDRRDASIDFLEEWLIATALRTNPDLKNNRKTKFLRNVHVIGVLNARHGEATKPAQLLRKGLGLQA